MRRARHEHPRVVIVGGGFGGLAAARALKRAEAEVVLFDKHNHHLFQPLLYQVATAALSPADIAAPLRRILTNQRNCEVIMTEVTDIDTEKRVVTVAGVHYMYDYLIVAAGAGTNYFGNDDWVTHAPGLKTIDEAIELRCRFLLAFEQAEIENDAEARRADLTFAIVGAGPTGVEMAGAMAEISRRTLRHDFRHLDTNNVRIILIDAQDHVLSGFAPGLSDRARRDLESLGVELMPSTKVMDVDAKGLVVEHKDGQERIDANNVIWAAGVTASPLGAALGAEMDRGGRVIVDDDLTVPGLPNVFVVGDLAHRDDPKSGGPVPGVAQGALQMGRFAGETVAAEIRALKRGDPAPKRRVFVYKDKGSLATIGRGKAVADTYGIRYGGFPAFFVWAFIHIYFLIGFRTRFFVLIDWIWMYVSYSRGVRLITGAHRVPKPVQPPPDERLFAEPIDERLEADVG